MYVYIREKNMAQGTIVNKKQDMSSQRGGDSIRRITDNTNLNNQMSPGQYLTELRKQLSSTIDNMKRLGIDLNPNELTLDESLAKIDNYLGNKLKEGLIKTFGDCGWSIKIDNYFRPFLSKGATKNDYRYILKNISWKNGPSSHQVFFYILENFKYYLQSNVYDPKLFSRTIPNIEKRGKSYFFPRSINGKEFKPIEINISRIYHKINEKTTLQYYIIDVVDKKLQIENIKHESKQGVFTKLQDMLEHIYYLPRYNETHKQLLKYEVLPIITPSLQEDNTPVTISNSSKLASRMIKTSSSSSSSSTASQQNKQEEFVEGDGLSGTDQTDIHNDSIPPEEAEFDRNESGEPVGPESGEGNLPPPPPPGAFGPPGGPESPEEEAREEAMEDPAEEANETPEQEAAEEQSEANEATEESDE